jgi:hypothetical protein
VAKMPFLGSYISRLHIPVQPFLLRLRRKILILGPVLNFEK